MVVSKSLGPVAVEALRAELRGGPVEAVVAATLGRTVSIFASYWSDFILFNTEHVGYVLNFEFVLESLEDLFPLEVAVSLGRCELVDELLQGDESSSNSNHYLVILSNFKVYSF